MSVFLHAKKKTLSNGMPVVWLNWEGAVCATYWWVQVGSIDEKAEEAGFAHFLEHMLFKDATQKKQQLPSQGVFARKIESLGGDINAYTSLEQTVYHVTCWEAYWEKILSIFSQMACRQHFSRTDFDREKEVILEEMRQGRDRPIQELYRHAYKQVFQKHPYGKDVIGHLKSIENATLVSLERFFKRFYHAGRMGLVLVGPIQQQRRKKLFSILEKSFGQIPCQKHSSQRVSEVAWSKQRSSFRKIPFGVSVPSFMVGIPIPGWNHPYLGAFEVLSQVFGEGETGRFYQRLFIKEKKVTHIQTALSVFQKGGSFWIQGHFLNKEDFGFILKKIEEEFFCFLKKRPLKDSEWTRVLYQIENEKKYALQTVDSIASRLGTLHFLIQNPFFEEEYFQNLKKITQDQLKQVLSDFLSPQRWNLTLLYPKKEKKQFSLSQGEVFSQLDLFKESQIKKSQKGKISILNQDGVGIFRERSSFLKKKKTFLFQKRPSGLRVVFVPRKGLEVMSVQAFALGGVRGEWAERKDLGGLSLLLGQTWTKGTRFQSAKEISEKVEGRAASLSGFSGKNTIGLEMTMIERDWEVLSRLFVEVLSQPTFPEGELEHTKRVVKDHLLSLKDHSFAWGMKCFLKTLFETHPYGKHPYGTEASIAKISSLVLKNIHRKWIDSKSLVISVCGNLNESQLEKFLSSIEESFSKRKKREGNLKSIQSEFSLIAPRWVRQRFGREQAHIIVGTLGTTVFSKDRFPLRLLQMILGGMSGRLFMELREKRSLAYSLSPIGFEGIEPGYQATYVSCAAEKEKEVLKQIYQVQHQLVERGLRKGELERVRKWYLGKRVMDLQTPAAEAMHLGLKALYGVPLLEEEAIQSQLQKVTEAYIEKTAEKYFIKRHPVISVVC